MPYKNVTAPTKGLFTVASGPDIEDEHSPYMSGVYLKDGLIVSDFGHTAYPAAGVLKTNALNGIFMRVDEFLLSSGVTRLVAHTTTNAYEYNTSTTTWDCITKGQTIEDCEDAWVASANVTATADTAVKLRGTSSSKLVIAAAFTTGVAAYEDFAAKDLTLETGVHFWVYSTVATAAGDIRLLLDNTSGCVSPLETLSIPALAANTWTPVYVAYANAAALTAVISVGLNVNVDIGAMTVYLDDIRSVDAFTGTADNLFSVGILNDTMISTNGINQPKKYAGTAATGQLNLTTTLAAGSITTSEFVLIAKDHVVFFNNTENGADAPQRGSWTNIGKIDDFIGGTAGYLDLTDDSSACITGEQLSQNTWAIYKGNSIVLMEWVGGQTPFRFTTMVKNQTIAGKASLVNKSGKHYVFGTKEAYTYDGGDKVTPIDVKTKRYLYSLVDYTYLLRSFVILADEDDEVQFWVPTTTQYPDTVFCVDTVLDVWYVKSRTMTGFGSYISGSALTIADLTGTIGDQNFSFGSTVTKSNTPIYLVGNSSGKVFRLDKATLNNDGSAITNEWQSKDFVFTEGIASSIKAIFGDSKEKSRLHTGRVGQLYVEAKGQSVTCEYSTDGGSTWNPTQTGGTNTISLVSSFKVYQQDLDVVSNRIRFRFKNSTASSGFYIRYFGFEWKSRSSR